MRNIFCILILFVMVIQVHAEESFDETTAPEITQLNMKIIDARKRIGNASLSRWGDMLQVLPTVSVSQSSPIGTSRKGDTYLSAAFSANQLWSVSDKRGSRDELKRKALRQIEFISFELRKLIERKYLLKERLWKFSKIRGSMNNPVEMAAMDEKIDEVRIKIQELEIAIEKGYAEIEFLCVGVER